MKPVEGYWYSTNLVAIVLIPLSWLFCLTAWLRSKLYATGMWRQTRLSVPVVVVGNITVGGTGKTPLVIWLLEYLISQGYRPGVISRGYGGNSRIWPRRVDAGSNPVETGDEPVLIAKRTGCPVWVGPDRPESAARLLETSQCDIIVSDDGLQHYPLARDIEIAVIDGERRFGNGLCLPAGPLRESRSRLGRVDIVVTNGVAQSGEQGMRLVTGDLVNLLNGDLLRSVEDFIGGPVHAVAGIGNPDRFFNTLRARGLDVIEHPFPDHHPFTSKEINFNDEFPVLMTEKDAVKCVPFARVCHWYLKVDAELESVFSTRLMSLLGDLHG